MAGFRNSLDRAIEKADVTDLLPPEDPKTKRSWKWAVAAAGTGLLIGGVLGSIGGAVVWNQTGPRLQSCSDALLASEQLFAHTRTSYDVMGDALTATAGLDVVGIRRATTELDKLSAPMAEARDRYETAAAGCRGR